MFFYHDNDFYFPIAKLEKTGPTNNLNYLELNLVEMNFYIYFVKIEK